MRLTKPQREMPLVRRWFQGHLSSPDSTLRVYEGTAFRNRLVAKFERAEDAAAAVDAHNVSLPMAVQQ